MASTAARGVELTLTLANGETYTWTGRKLPRHWKSVLMQLAPYGTDYSGATWARKHI
jgi:hypothetical protein